MEFYGHLKTGYRDATDAATFKMQQNVDFRRTYADAYTHTHTHMILCKYLLIMSAVKC